MKKILVLVAVLYSAAAIAQTSDPAKPPPTVGGKPLVQVKPKAAKKDAAPADAAATDPAAKDTAPKASAKSAKSAPGQPKSMAQKLQACLDIDDGTKERLNCYDAIYPPKPNPKEAAAKGVADCRFKPEEDDRLACFNDFAERIPKLPKS